MAMVSLILRSVVSVKQGKMIAENQEMNEEGKSLHRVRKCSKISVGYEGPGVPVVCMSGQKWPLVTSMGGTHFLVLFLPRFFNPFCPHKLTIFPLVFPHLPTRGHA